MAKIQEIDFKSIAIIGVACRMPGAQNSAEFWDILCSGKDCLDEFPLERQQQIDKLFSQDVNSKKKYFKGSFLNKIDKFDNDFFKITPKEASLMDPDQRLFLETAYEAIEDAGYCKGKIKGSKTGVFIGYSDDKGFKYRNIIENSTEISNPLVIPGNLPSIIPGRVSYFLDLKGPSLLIDTACSSSLVALHSACQSIRNGESDMALVGGIRTILFPDPDGVKAGMESNSGVTRAFDDSAEGTGLGEAVVALLIKPAEQAIEDGDHIYSIIKGSAVNQDGSSVGITAPNLKAQTDVIISAWENAGIDPREISYMEAHGTATRLGDPIEINAISSAFRRFTDEKQFCAIGSLKTNIGHSFAAAGLSGILKVALSLKHKMIPASLNFNCANSEINFPGSPLFVNTKLSSWEVKNRKRLATVSSFGFSGTNCHVVMEEAPVPKANKVSSDYTDVLLISGQTKEKLLKLSEKYLHLIESKTNDELKSICYTAATCRDHLNYRVAFVFSTNEELSRKISCFLKGKYENTSNYFCSQENETVKKEEVEKLAERVRNVFADKVDKNQSVLTPIAEAYCKGVEINWNILYKKERIRKISIPTYLYNHKEFWIEGSLKNVNSSKPLEQSQSVNSDESILKRLTDLVVFYTGFSVNELDVNKNFFEMGLDSLLLTQVKQAVEKEFNVSVPVSSFFKENDTLNNLHFYLQGKIRENPRTSSLTEKADIIKNNGTVSKSGDHFVPYKALEKSSGRKYSVEQQKYLSEFISRFEGRTDRSKWETQESRSVLANNRNSAGFRPEWKEIVYQLTSKEAKGSKFTDLNDKEYIDLTMGFGVSLFGNNPEFIQKAIAEELTKGLNVGPMSYLAGKVAGLICELTGNERAAFYNSGTEAIMVALRLARTKTSRSKVVIFSGSYHGTFDGVLGMAFNNKISSIPIAPGIIPSMVEDIIVLEYGTKRSLEIISEYGSQIAAVLVEPVQSRRPDFQPKDFLQDLRKITEKIGAALILDEVITGFRIHIGGAQAWFNLKADIVVYGKIVGGGMPIGVVSGKAEYLDGVDGGMWKYGDNSYPDKPTTFVAGTFCQHPLAMRASYETLEFLRKQGNSLQEQLNNKTTLFVNKLNQYFVDEKIPIKLVNFGSLFRFNLNGEWEFLYHHLIEKGIYIWEGRNCFLSTAHSDKDIEFITKAVKDSVNEMINGKWVSKQPHRSNDLKGAIRKDNISYNNGQKTEIPLSHSQARMWWLSQMSKNKINHSLLMVYELKGDLNKEKLKLSYKFLFERHESLRTVFYESNGEPFQKILDNGKVDPELKFLDLKGSSVDEFEKEVRVALNKKYDIERELLVNGTLLEIENDRYILALSANHLVVDGWSINILLDEWAAVYNSFLNGKEPQLSDVSNKYINYISEEKAYLDSEMFQSDLDYWRKNLERPILPISLPGIKPRPSNPKHEGKYLKHSFSGELYKGFKDYSKKENISLFNVLLSFVNLLLQKYTGHKYISLGTTVLGRLSEEHMKCVGNYINNVVLCNEVDPSITFSEFSKTVRNNLYDSLDHQRLPFDEVVSHIEQENRESGRSAFYDILIQFETGDLARYGKSGNQFEDLHISPYNIGTDTVDLDLYVEFSELNGKLDIKFEYNSELYNESHIRNFIFDFETLSQNTLADPEKKLEEISFSKLTTALFINGETINENSARYWENCISTDLPLVTIPFGKKNAIDYGGAWTSEMGNINALQTHKLKEISRTNTVTLLQSLITIVNALLYKCSGQNDLAISINLPFPIIVFSEKDNLIPLRTTFPLNSSFNELTSLVKSISNEAFRNRHFPFNKLMEDRGLLKGRKNLSNVIVQFKSINNDLDLCESNGKVERDSISNSDLAFIFEEINGAISFKLCYQKNSFSQELISQLAKQFTTLIGRILEEPNLPLNQVEFLDDKDKKILEGLQGSGKTIPGSKDLFSCLEGNLTATGELPAIYFENELLTWNDWNNRINYISGILRNEVNVNHQQKIAVIMERNLWLPSVIMAIMKCGGVYIPVDPNYPKQYIDLILETSEAVLVLTDRSSNSVLSANSKVKVLIIEDINNLYDPKSEYEFLLPVFKPGELACILFTSGSTGKPKGVKILHDGIRALLTWATEEYGKSDFSIVYFITTICFDLSIFEMFFPVWIGKPMRILKDSTETMDALQKDKKVLLNTVPSVVERLLKQGSDLNNISVLNMAGEQISDYVINNLDGKQTEVRNLYGPTEDTVYSTCYLFPENDKRVLIGKPIYNTQVYLLDDNLKLVPLGFPGEIYLAGDGLSGGYIGNAELTAKAFIDNPFSFKKGSKMYKTGDLACWSKEGQLQFLGRKDQQLKINGYRIEPGEVEYILNQHEEIEKALVLTQKREESNENLLVAYIVKKKNETTLSGPLSDLSKEIQNTKEDQSVKILSEDELLKLADEFNNTKPYFPIDSSVIEIFEKMAIKFSNKIAVRFGERSITYSELNARANQIAHYINSKIVLKDDDLVAILMDRSIEMVESILAIWKLGAAYVPIDPKYPIQRIQTLISDSKSKLILIDQIPNAGEAFDTIIAEPICLILEEIGIELDKESSENIKRSIDINSLAYVIYTSGSTGKPKGAMIEHLGMINHIGSKVVEMGMDSSSIVAQNASQCFDISVWQMFAALITGGETVIYPYETILNPKEFIYDLTKNEITVLELVPSYFVEMLEVIEEKNEMHLLKSLKILILNAETLFPTLVKRWFDVNSTCPIVNTYGATEVSDDISHYIMHTLPGTETIPVLKKPIQHFKVYIVDDQMKLCPIGQIGEILISGPAVGRGYFNDEERTKAVFFNDPFTNIKNVRMYKTGDLGVYHLDGTMEFIGRKDSQVKVQGHRVELGEIQHKLTSLQEVREACVTVNNNEEGHVVLCAYYSLKKDYNLSSEELKSKLKESLPQYMIPEYFIHMERFPLNENGKIDRKLLPNPLDKNNNVFVNEVRSFANKRLPYYIQPSHYVILDGFQYTPNGKIDRKKLPPVVFNSHSENAVNIILPTNALQGKILEIWKKVLQNENIGTRDNFFEIGGNSMKLISLYKSINNEFPNAFRIADLFEHSTIEGQASLLNKESEAEIGRFQEISF